MLAEVVRLPGTTFGPAQPAARKRDYGTLIRALWSERVCGTTWVNYYTKDRIHPQSTQTTVDRYNSQTKHQAPSNE